MKLKKCNLPISVIIHLLEYLYPRRFFFRGGVKSKKVSPQTPLPKSMFIIISSPQNLKARSKATPAKAMKPYSTRMVKSAWF
jgi:hypothetical protein